MDPFNECLRQISSLSSLSELSLKFTKRVSNPTPPYYYNEYGTENIELRTSIPTALFTALDGGGEDGVTCLSLENLQDFSRGVYEMPEFVRVSNKLKGLHLHIATEYSETGPDRDIDIPGKHTFFNSTLNSHFLAPMAHQLTHLSFYCSTFWGVYPRWDSRSLHFPALRSLSLGNWSVAHEWQVECMLAHTGLEELWLDDYPVVYAGRIEGGQVGRLEWEDGEIENEDGAVS
jgi:hypothetical protein